MHQSHVKMTQMIKIQLEKKQAHIHKWDRYYRFHLRMVSFSKALTECFVKLYNYALNNCTKDGTGKLRDYTVPRSSK